MKISDREKLLIATSLKEKVGQLSVVLSNSNAGESEWKEVDELSALAEYIEFTLINDDYVR